MVRSVLSIILFLFVSCSTGPSKKEAKPLVLDPKVQKVIDQAREFLNKGQTKEALTKLTEIHDDNLTEIEKAVKYNLRGVIFFTENTFEKSLANFEISKKYVPEDSHLESQVYLNISSIYFKQGLFPQLKESLNKVEVQFLSDVETKKYAQLELAWALKYEKHFQIVESSLLITREAKTINDVQNSPLKEKIIQSFSHLDDGEKEKLYEKYDQMFSVALGFLAQIDAEKKYFNNDKRGARQLAQWIEENFSKEDTLKRYANDLNQRLDFGSSLSMSGVGVVLPMTGDKASFGQKALLGIETALKNIDIGRPLEIFTKDTLGSQTVASQAVKDIILENKVPLIIGGLFQDTAKAEYLEAKRYGVFFISLAPINLPKEEKNYLLIEIQGSTESQINKLLTDEFLNKFGRKVGVVYPEGEQGKAYSDEFWRASLENKIKITAIASYPKNSVDYRDTIQHLLGLKFPRERKEENTLWQDIYSKEKSTIRRIQYLPPDVDFDWIFLASFPHESLSLIPTLGYYDARDVKIVGGPSWSSKQLVQEQKNLGKLFFIGEDPASLPKEFFTQYQALHGKPPSLIETLSYEAMKVGLQVLKDGTISRRDELNEIIKKTDSFEGLSKSWKLVGGLWNKDLDSLQINRGEITRLELDTVR